jgi:hypothetical protein
MILQKLLTSMVLAGGGITVVLNTYIVNQSPGSKIKTIETVQPTPTSTEKVQGSKPIDSTKISKNSRSQAIADPNQTKNREGGDIEGDDLPKIKPEEEGFKEHLRIVTYPKH